MSIDRQVQSLTNLVFKVKAVGRVARETTEDLKKLGEAGKAVAPDPNASNISALEAMESFGGFGPSLKAVLDNLRKLVETNEKAWREGKASTNDLFELAKYIQKDVDYIRTWGGAAGQAFNFDAFKRQILEGAGKEAEKAVGRVIEKEKREARTGTGGFGFAGNLPTKPVDTLAQQVSTGQLRG